MTEAQLALGAPGQFVAFFLPRYLVLEASMAENMATRQPFWIIKEVLADWALELVVQVLVLLASQADWAF